MKITPEQANTTDTIGYDPNEGNEVSSIADLWQDKRVKIGCIVVGVILLVLIVYRMGSTPVENTDTTTEAVTTEAVEGATEATEAGAVEATEAPASETSASEAPAEETPAEEETDSSGEETEVETPPTTPR